MRRVGLVKSFWVYVMLLMSAPAVFSDVLLKKADRYFEEESYKLAYQAYAKLGLDKRSQEQQDHIRLRMLVASIHTSKSQERSTHFNALAKFTGELAQRQVGRPPEIWAHAHVALGDTSILRHRYGSHATYQYYKAALDWWAMSTDIERARGEYVKVLHKYLAKQNRWRQKATLDQAAKIAQSPHDLGVVLLYLVDHHRGDQAQDTFARLVDLGHGSKVHDQALYRYANWLAAQGAKYVDKNGRQQRRPDYAAALVQLKKYFERYGKRTSDVYGQAKSLQESIVAVQANVSVHSAYRDHEKPFVNLRLRNVKSASLEIYAADLVQDLSIRSANAWSHWYDYIIRDKKRHVRSVKIDVEEQYKHQQLSLNRDLDEPLPTGSYVVRLVAKDQTGRKHYGQTLLMVSHSTVTANFFGKEGLIYVAEGDGGAPVADAPVVVFEGVNVGRKERWLKRRLKTNAEGVVKYTLEENSSGRIFIAAKTKYGEAFTRFHTYNRGSQRKTWKIYAFTDRPVYRPGQTVNWKIIAKTQQGNKEIYTDHPDKVIKYTIRDGRSQVIKKGELRLSELGTAASKFVLPADASLGAVQVEFREDSNWIAAATLFRLEEYKRPEYQAKIKAGDDGKTYLNGDKIPVKIEANYYSGGAVVNAKVNVIVRRKNHYQTWYWPREFDWYHSASRRNYDYYRHQRGSEVERHQLTTDKDGKTSFVLKTTADHGASWRYTIEARVIDESRREIVSNAELVVANQPYQVRMKPAAGTYTPGDLAVIDIRAFDANNKPVAATGKVTLKIGVWHEKWYDAFGGVHEKNSELCKCYRRHPYFKYEEVEIADAQTNADGEGSVTFKLPKSGVYSVHWSSPAPVHGNIVASTQLTAYQPGEALPMQQGGLIVLADKEVYTPGDVARIAVLSREDKHVLVTVGDERYRSHATAQVKDGVAELSVAVGREHQPNTFVTAQSIFQRNLHSAQRELFVPPQDKFLNVKVGSDQADYLPRDKGLLEVQVTDNKGQPVAAELAVSVVDASLYYLQEPLAGDITQFLYSRKRGNFLRPNFSGHQVRLRAPKPIKKDGEEISDGQIAVADDSSVAVSSDEDQDRAFSKQRRNVAQPVAAPAPLRAEMTFGAALADSNTSSTVSGRLGNEMVAGNKAPAGRLAPAESKKDAGPSGPRDAGDAGQSSVVVRHDFRETALWVGSVKTNAEGKARLEVPFPDSLTRWKTTVRAIGSNTRVGQGEASAQTKMPLMTRLQAPRFLTTGDEVVLTGVYNNHSNKALSVKANIRADGVVLLGRRQANGFLHKAAGTTLEMAAGETAKVDWVYRVENAGMANVTLSGVAGEISDAEQRRYPIYQYGLQKHVIESGHLQDENLATIQFNLPAQRAADATSFAVQVTPSMATTLVDSLPYLIEYPHGCVEQTTSRFVPTAIVAKALTDLGLSTDDVLARAFGGIEAKHAGSTHSSGKKNLRKLDAMLEQGYRRLLDLQTSDGGWGWFKGNASDPYMTAYVHWALSLAKQNGVKSNSGALNGRIDRALINSRRYLLNNLRAQKNLTTKVWMLYAASMGRKSFAKVETHEFRRLWKQRSELNDYGRALLLLVAHQRGAHKSAAVLARNLLDRVTIDSNPSQSVLIPGRKGSRHTGATAYWGQPSGYWRWQNGAVETTSWVLYALTTIQSKDPVVEQGANWLLKNRRGAQWNNTRDTSMAVLALTQYLRASGQLSQSMEYEVHVNGKLLTQQTIHPKDAITAPTRFEVNPAWLVTGSNRIEIRRRKGEGMLYFMTHASFFTQEATIAPAGHEVFVRRFYERIEPTQTLGGQYVSLENRFASGETIESGARLRVSMMLETKNNYEYLMVEDVKPAGIEAVQLKSGQRVYARKLTPEGAQRVVAGQPIDQRHYDRGSSRVWVYQELRDRKVVNFIDKLPQGHWLLQYELRAEVPGTFQAVPATAEAMYVPEIKANSASGQVRVKD